MLEYSEACVTMANDLVNTRRKVMPFDTLVIPSRGAFPFFLGMTYLLKKLITFGDDFKDIHRKDLRVLLIPFTADLNIPKFDPDESNEEYTEKTREYWARVTHAFFKEPKLRSKDPYFKTFAEIILGNLEGRDKTVQIYEQFPQIGRFAMIDTVISGRASNDILGAFDQISAEQQQRGIIDHANISPFAFLIVDENSEKLEKHQGFNAY